MTTEPNMPPLPEPFLCDTMLGNRPCTLKYYQPSFVQARDQQWAERVAELEREKETVLQDRVALAMRVEELERVLGVARVALEQVDGTFVLLLGGLSGSPEPGSIGADVRNAIATIDAARSKAPT